MAWISRGSTLGASQIPYDSFTSIDSSSFVMVDRNWLRDYSQAVDIASLKKLPLQASTQMVVHGEHLT